MDDASFSDDFKRDAVHQSVERGDPIAEVSDRSGISFTHRLDGSRRLVSVQTMKPFLILQVRPETQAADDEFRAILAKGCLGEDDVVRARLDCETLPSDMDLADYSAIIIGGGPGCVSDPEEKKTTVEKSMEEAVLGLLPAIIKRDFPLMGCCYGIGTLAHALGGHVSQDRYGESVGAVSCSLTDEGCVDPLLAGFPETFLAFVGHKEAVQTCPPGAVNLVRSAPCPFQMIRYGKNVYATQFHPEADAAVFETRIRLYRTKGYFAPEKADELIAACREAAVTVPEQILHRFVRRYKQP